jgi:hypothetical protein
MRGAYTRVGAICRYMYANMDINLSQSKNEGSCSRDKYAQTLRTALETMSVVCGGIIHAFTCATAANICRNWGGGKGLRGHACGRSRRLKIYEKSCCVRSVCDPPNLKQVGVPSASNAALSSPCPLTICAPPAPAESMLESGFRKKLLGKTAIVTIVSKWASTGGNSACVKILVLESILFMRFFTLLCSKPKNSLLHAYSSDTSFHTQKFAPC